MERLKDSANFDEEMSAVFTIMKHKGFMVEADHPYAYSMQYGAAFEDVTEWLAKNGYDGNFGADSHFEPCAGAVYGLYDKDRISYEKMHKELIKEGKRQAKMY